MQYSEYNEELINQGWEQMEALLNREMPVRTPFAFWKSWLVWLFLFGMLAALSRDSGWRHLPSPARPAVSLNAWPVLQGETGKDKLKREQLAGKPLIPVPGEEGEPPGEVSPGRDPNPGESGFQPVADPSASLRAQGDDDPNRTRAGTSSRAVDKLFESIDNQNIKRIEPFAPVPYLGLTELEVTPAVFHLDASPEVHRSKWSWGPVLGLGVAFTDSRGLAWVGFEGEYLIHRKWAVFGRLTYQWNRLGESNIDPVLSSVQEDVQHSGPTRSEVVYVTRNANELAAHRVGLLASGAFYPHRNIRLEGGFQLNYFDPHESNLTTSGEADEFSAVVPGSSQVVSRELEFRRWEPLLHAGLYWRFNTGFQLGLSWQEGLLDLSKTEGYRSRSQSLYLGARWRFGR